MGLHEGEQGSTHYFDARGTRGFGGLQTSVRRDAQRGQEQGQDRTDHHRQPGERISTQQAYDDEVPRVRSAHGTILLHEENECSDGCEWARREANKEADSLASV